MRSRGRLARGRVDSLLTHPAVFPAQRLEREDDGFSLFGADVPEEVGFRIIQQLLDLLAGQFRSHGYDQKFLIRAITGTKAYALTSAVGRSETAPANLFAAMPVRTLSPGQLFETLAQATGFRDGSRGPFVYEGSAKDRFVELFTNRDEKPTEGETSILQALALMNGPLMASVTSPETSDTLAAVAQAPYLDTPGRIETLYLAALCRRPRPDELQRLVPYVERGGPSGDCSKALADVFWALLNSPEFRFNH